MGKRCRWNHSKCQCPTPGFNGVTCSTFICEGDETCNGQPCNSNKTACECGNGSSQSDCSGM